MCEIIRDLSSTEMISSTDVVEKDTTTLLYIVVELYLSTALYSVEEIGTIWKLEKIFGELENFQHNIGTTRNRGMMLVLRVLSLIEFPVL